MPRIEHHKVACLRGGLHVATYTSPRDFLNFAKKGKQRGEHDAPTEWAGGTWDYMERGLTGRVLDYCDAARDKAGHFTNVALADYGVDFEYNTQYGVLDYQAAVAGNPAFMYGATITETDRSPIEIYIDTWVPASVKASTMEKRGIGILALIQALQVYRPVHVYVTKGSMYSPKDANTLQLCPIPTQPMDLARASFMLCSPTVNRWGMLSTIHEVHKASAWCGSPPMSDLRWQTETLPKWVAERHGVKDYLFMRGMHNASFWGKDVVVIDWIKEQITKFVGEINA